MDRDKLTEKNEDDALAAFVAYRSPPDGNLAPLPTLTLEEERFLAQRIEQGDRQARRILVNANLRLVHSIARRYETYQNHDLSREDLIKAGTPGLLHAADKFDHRRGFRFSTYATHWIRQAIHRAIAKEI